MRSARGSQITTEGRKGVRPARLRDRRDRVRGGYPHHSPHVRVGFGRLVHLEVVDLSGRHTSDGAG